MQYMLIFPIHILLFGCSVLSTAHKSYYNDGNVVKSSKIMVSTKLRDSTTFDETAYNDNATDERKFAVKTVDELISSESSTVPLLKKSSLDDTGSLTLSAPQKDQQLFNNNLSSNSTNACSAQATCESCYNYSTAECHWCSSDHACHARASPYGCVVGASCSTPAPAPAPAPTKPPHEQKKNCKDYTNCTDCTLSSWGCHWCSFDNKCHAVGSIYGCTYGVNCYSNQRCQRSDPQFVYNSTRSLFGSVPPLVGFGCMVIAASLLGCLTLCFCGAHAVKGAYEDLVVSTAVATAEVVMEQQTLVMGSNMSRHQSVRQVTFCNGAKGNRGSGAQLDRVVEGDGDASSRNLEKNKSGAKPSLDVTTLIQSEEAGADHQNPFSWEEKDDDDDASSLSRSLLVHDYGTGPSWANNYPTASSILSRKTTIPKSRNAQYLFGVCGFCYFVSSILVILLFVFFLRYFPQLPQYNICSNEFDWKSIVDGMTSAKIGGSFQILFSIYNPNRFDVDLSLGSGTFKHDGTYVGRFEIPPQTKVAQQAITDLLVTVTLRPDKWEALALTAEYYKGTLTFEVDMSMAVSAPFLGGYSYQANFDNYLVHVSDANTDRSLCACPQWSDVKPPHHVSDGVEKQEGIPMLPNAEMELDDELLVGGLESTTS